MDEEQKAKIDKTKAEATKIYVDTYILPFEALAKGVQTMLIEDGTNRFSNRLGSQAGAHVHAKEAASFLRLSPWLAKALPEIACAQRMATNPKRLSEFVYPGRRASKRFKGWTVQ